MPVLSRSVCFELAGRPKYPGMQPSRGGAMSADTQVENTGAPAADQRPRQADGYVWKLRVTCACLVFWVIVCVGGLGTLLYYRQIFSTGQPWALSALVAGLGG